MTSIRGRLIAILIGTTGIVWLGAAAWIYVSTQAEVKRVLDARILEGARMVNSLVADRRIELAAGLGLDDKMPARVSGVERPYDRQLSCQIWSLDGRLVGRSAGAPEAKLSGTNEGFSENTIDGETWRVYAVENAELGVRVMVGDSLRMRDGLVGGVVKGLLVPAGLALPFLAAFIWLSVRRGLAPLSDMANALSNRAANDLRPVPDANLPTEIAPTVDALNDLFKRVQDAREREQNFIAFAAHELKTPLAGLKTQAQIALSGDPTTQEKALRQISAGVDRTDRLAKQLLDVAMLEAGDVNPARSKEQVISLVRMGIADFEILAAGRSIETQIRVPDLDLEVHPQFFLPAFRNLLDNALNHAPAGSKITCRIERSQTEAVIAIEDEGPGIPDAELPHVAEKFFRGRHRSPTGSGLGLAIAQIAVTRMAGTLCLANRKPAGLCASILLPLEKAARSSV